MNSRQSRLPRLFYPSADSGSVVRAPLVSRGILTQLGWLDRIFLLGVGIICLNDYVSSIWEIRLERQDYLTAWTIRIAGVPLAEVFVLGCLIITLPKLLARAEGRPLGKMPLDWYVGVILFATTYGVVVGVATFTQNDYWREMIYDVRLPIDFFAVYWLTSRIPRNAEQVHRLWRLLFVYCGIFYITNLGGWFIWVYGLGYTPFGALGTGTLILTDAGNVAFLAYTALIGLVILITGTEARAWRRMLGLLAVASFMILLISFRRSNLLALGLSLPLTLLILGEMRIVIRIAKIIPLFLVVWLLLFWAGLRWGEYVDAFFTLLDRSYLSTEMRYVGNENALLTIKEYDLWWSGLGLGRRYRAYVVLSEGENLTAFSENEIGRAWRKNISVAYPILGLWLQYGVIVGSILEILPWYMIVYIWKQKHRYLQDRARKVLIVTSLVACMTPFPVLGLIDPKNALLMGLVFGLCSATMHHPPRQGASGPV